MTGYFRLTDTTQKHLLLRPNGLPVSPPELLPSSLACGATSRCPQAQRQIDRSSTSLRGTIESFGKAISDLLAFVAGIVGTGSAGEVRR